MNSVAKIHGYFQISLDKMPGSMQGSNVQGGWMRTTFNGFGMVPAALINYAALVDDNVGVYLHAK